MLNFNSLIIFSEKPGELAEFYKKIFHKDPEWSGGDFQGFKVGDGFLTIGPHDKVHGKNMNPERLMFNMETDNVESEFQRIKDLGAEVIAEPYHPGEDEEGTICTFADPDGNYFQVTTMMGMEEDEEEEEDNKEAAN